MLIQLIKKYMVQKDHTIFYIIQRSKQNFYNNIFLEIIILSEVRQRKTNIWYHLYVGFPGGSDVKESACNAADLGSNPWVGKMPWRRAWQPTPVFLPGASPWQRCLGGYSPWGRKELDMTEWLGTAQHITYMWNLKKHKWTYLQNRLTDIENNLKVTKGERDKLGIWV